jgi:ribonuclease HI
MESRHWIHRAKHITIVDGQEKTTRSLQVYTDEGKSVAGVGAWIAVLGETNLIATQMYRLNGQCTNNQVEHLAILKALECIQNREETGKTAIINTDSRITLQVLTNHKKTLITN